MPDIRYYHLLNISSVFSFGDNIRYQGRSFFVPHCYEIYNLLRLYLIGAIQLRQENFGKSGKLLKPTDTLYITVSKPFSSFGEETFARYLKFMETQDPLEAKELILDESLIVLKDKYPEVYKIGFKYLKLLKRMSLEFMEGFSNYIYALENQIMLEPSYRSRTAKEQRLYLHAVNSFSEDLTFWLDDSLKTAVVAYEKGNKDALIVYLKDFTKWLLRLPGAVEDAVIAQGLPSAMATEAISSDFNRWGDEFLSGKLRERQARAKAQALAV